MKNAAIERVLGRGSCATGFFPLVPPVFAAEQTCTLAQVAQQSQLLLLQIHLLRIGVG